MQLKRTLISLCWITSVALAQTPPAAPAAQPTMQEAIDFISDLYAKQGPIQWNGKDTSVFNNHTEQFVSVKLEDTCSLLVKKRERQTLAGTPWQFSGNTMLLDLARSEPTSISIKPSSDTSPIVYSVEVGHAFRKVRTPVDAINDSPAVPLPPGVPPATNAGGVVQSYNEGSILFVSVDGQLFRYTPTKGTAIAYALPTNDPLYNKPVQFSDIAVGNIIFFNWQGVKIVPSTPPRDGYDVFYLLSVTDKDVATRMAKALIHAMVLCHKDDKPSPF